MLKKRKVICITIGRHSDFSVMGHYIVLADFCQKTEMKRFLEETGIVHDYGIQTKFMEWMIDKGLIANLDDCIEMWHISDLEGTLSI